MYILWEEPNLKSKQSWESRGVTPFAFVSPFCYFFSLRECGAKEKPPVQRPGLIRCMTMNKLLPALVLHFLLHKIKLAFSSLIVLSQTL